MSTSHRHAILVTVLAALLGVPGVAQTQPTPTAPQTAQTPQERLLLETGAADTAFGIVHLREDSGTCAPIHKTPRIKLSRSKRQRLVLILVNDCATPVKFAVSNFAHRTLRAAPDPLVTAQNDRERTIPANRATLGFLLRIRSDATVGLWNYDIMINGKVIDPELEIEI